MSFFRVCIFVCAWAAGPSAIADLILIDPVATGAFREDGLDGNFDDGVLKNDATTAWWPLSGTAAGAWRTAFEFDLSDLNGKVKAANLTVSYDFVRGDTVVELYGYVGDGSVATTDVTNPSARLIDSISLAPKSSLPLVDLTFDISREIRRLVRAGEHYVGFYMKVADDLAFASGIGQITNIWTGRLPVPDGTGLDQGPRLSIKVPEPSTLTLLGAGLLGVLVLRRQRVGLQL